MFATIAAKDVREIIRDGRLLWAGGLVVLLMLVALAAGWNRQAQVSSERLAGQALDYEAWLQQQSASPRCCGTGNARIQTAAPARGSRSRD